MMTYEEKRAELLWEMGWLAVMVMAAVCIILLVRRIMLQREMWVSFLSWCSVGGISITGILTYSIVGLTIMGAGFREDFCHHRELQRELVVYREYMDTHQYLKTLPLAEKVEMAKEVGQIRARLQEWQGVCVGYNGRVDKLLARFEIQWKYLEPFSPKGDVIADSRHDAR